MDTSTALNIQFSPLLPETWLIFAGFAAILFVLPSLLKRQRGFGLRIICVAAFILALLNPTILQEEREAVSDVAVIVTDFSPSQAFGERQGRTQKALSYLERNLQNKEDLEVRFVNAPLGNDLTDETRLFEALDQSFSDVPLKRRAGAVLITDGQIHDVPEIDDAAQSVYGGEYGPVHVLLSGEPDEIDRQIVIKQAPSYGIVGDRVSAVFQIQDTGNVRGRSARVTLKQNDQASEVLRVQTGKDITIDLPVEHAGQNVFTLQVDAIPGEITQANNNAAIIINGVRDRLRVLLVSGQPHAGGRTWRDLLTSDPGVDLVHFTILREPDKLDSTPQRELSLIAFPFRELFEVKLNEFDLIIFDRYRLNHILPHYYFQNIVEYVYQGGALLEASGPEFASDDSIYTTALEDVLPGLPDGNVFKTPYKPELSQQGKLHPVTRDLDVIRSASGDPLWGNWLRQVSIMPKRGDVVMQGMNDKPLLILDRIQQGRVAQIASDQIWLWSRGYEGGGPHSDLLRKVVHWLMKEPELDERALNVSVNDKTITLSRQNYGDIAPNITMTKPDGAQETLALNETKSGLLELSLKAEQLGIYSFEDSQRQKRVAVIGSHNPPELSAIKSTDALVKNYVAQTKGGVFWLSDTPSPDIGHYSNRNRYAGSSWLGFRKNDAYAVTGLESYPVLPSWLITLILLAFCGITWWYEGRKS